MACKFSCVLELREKNKEVIFRSTDGEVYNMKYTYAHQNLICTLNWKTVASVSIMIEIWVDEYNSSVGRKCEMIKDNQASIKLPIKTHHYGPRVYYICTVSVIPHMELQIFATQTEAISEENELFPITKIMQNKLTADMQSLLRTGIPADIILSNGSIQADAHKVLLSARSPVFAKMFQHPMKENSENHVDVSEITDAAFKELFTFIYTGILTIENMDMAQELYIAAYKYEIQDLRDFCSNTLKNVNVENVLDILVLSILYDDKDLKQSLMTFILKNYVPVKSHNNWDTFAKENKDLSIEVLSYVVDKTLGI